MVCSLDLVGSSFVLCYSQSFLVLSLALAYGPNLWLLLLSCELSEISAECPRHSVRATNSDWDGSLSCGHQCLYSAFALCLASLSLSVYTYASDLGQGPTRNPQQTSPPTVPPCVTPSSQVLCPEDVNSFSRFKPHSLPPSDIVIWKVPLGWTSGWTRGSLIIVSFLLRIIPSWMEVKFTSLFLKVSYINMHTVQN